MKVNETVKDNATGGLVLQILDDDENLLLDIDITVTLNFIEQKRPKRYLWEVRDANCKTLASGEL